MKKNLFVAAAALLALGGLASCGGNKSCNNSCDGNGACDGKKGDKTEIYTGVLPAADCDGIRYTLNLEFDDDHNYTDGDYDLTEAYLEADTTAVGGFKDLKVFRSEGDFTVETRDGQKYLKLVQDRKDSQNGSAEGPLYFLVDNDSTITLVNADLQRSESQLNYSLTRK